MARRLLRGRPVAKIYVDVLTPGNGKTYEFQTDDGILVSAAIIRMGEEIISLEEGNMIFDEKTMLFNVQTGQVLPNSKPLSSAGVKSGHKLILV